MEMVVVMAIVAILSLLSGSAFIAARDQAIVSETAEEVLSSIREVQNFSIAVQDGNTNNSNETKIWGIFFTKDAPDYSTFYYDAAPNSKIGATINATSKPLKTGVTISTSKGTDEDTSKRYIFFSTPFGKTNTANGGCSTAMNLATAPATCHWKEGVTADKSWVPVGVTSSNFANDEIKIKISYKGKTQSIVVNSRGDSYIE